MKINVFIICIGSHKRSTSVTLSCICKSKLLRQMVKEEAYLKENILHVYDH